MYECDDKTNPDGEHAVAFTRTMKKLEASMPAMKQQDTENIFSTYA